MKKISILFAATIFSLTVYSQSFLQDSLLVNRPAQKEANFYDIQRAFEHHWEGKTPSQNECENNEEGGYQQFKRWEWFFEQRTYPTGNFPSPEAAYNSYRNYPWANSTNRSMMAANWSFMGPGVVPGNGGGAGRLNCMEFDPTNSNTIWVGAACGGLWKSTDGGNTWSSNTDLLPSLSISEIVIDPTNPQTMYIATGDKYGIFYQYEVWGHYSAGVLKSTDGGVTWNPTGMNYSLANVTIIQRLIIDPTSTNTLYAATNNGIFKTTDGGTTWNNIRAGSYFDIEMKPGTSSTLYAVDGTNFYYSIDNGATWTTGAMAAGERVSIAVTPVNPVVVYVWAQNSGLMYSNTSGTSFTNRTDPAANAGPYGYYDYVIEISPVNENIIFAGGLDIARSTNGGNSWTTVSDWNGWPASDYSHADNHAQKFAPGSQTTIYSCNDGGLFRSTDQGATWTDLSHGMDIKQYYRIGGSYLTPNLIYAGAQDNGTDKITGMNTATQVNGADGEECLVDFTDDNIVFVSSQGGYFLRSTDGGVTFNGITVFGCDWTSPLVMDPNNHNVLYLGSASVEKSTNNGVSWTTLNGPFDGGCMYSLEVAPANSNYIYAATFAHIYRSTNGGANWTDITGSLPTSSGAITGITISDANPDNVWVTFSGFTAGDKVYYTPNGGGTWSNFSGTLPNVPANCIEYQNNSNELLYVGTDLGVFYRDGSMSDWSPYNTGMPNVIIDELEIHYPTSKIRAATFGRGIWESDLQTSTLLAVDASPITMNSPTTTTCDTVITPQITLRNNGVNTLTSVTISYRVDNLPWQQYNWTGSLATSASAPITLNTYTLTAGAHTLNAYTSNPNSSSDMNNNNDTLLRTFTINSAVTGSTPPPITEGFVSTTFPPAGWAIENSTNLWSRNGTVGGYGNSTNCAKAEFYTIANGEDMLISMYVDFSTALPPIRLYFDLAYAPYNNTYIDSLVIDMYSVCPGQGVRKYAKGNTQLATVPATPSSFTPTSAQWRTDTINLDTMAGHPPMQIRFIAKSGYGNNLYIDNINLTANGVGIESIDNETSFAVYPNPATNTITIEVNGTNNSAGQIIVYDLLGNLVQTNEMKQGNSRISLDVSQWAEGVYLIQWQHDGVLETRRVVVAR
jgi:photosystem II stability/assembly factor-like uncharacterized protein